MDNLIIRCPESTPDEDRAGQRSVKRTLPDLLMLIRESKGLKIRLKRDQVIG